MTMLSFVPLYIRVTPQMVRSRYQKWKVTLQCYRRCRAWTRRALWENEPWKKCEARISCRFMNQKERILVRGAQACGMGSVLFYVCSPLSLWMPHHGLLGSMIVPLCSIAPLIKPLGHPKTRSWSCKHLYTCLTLLLWVIPLKWMVILTVV